MGLRTHQLPAPASSERRSLTCLAQGPRHADRVKRAHFSCHGQGPLGVGPCIRSTLSQTATPLLGPHYRVSTLVWMAPTSKHHRPCPCSYTCSRVPASSEPTLGSPWLPRILNVRLDTASDPGEYQRRSPARSASCCLPAGQDRRHSPTKTFGAQHLQGRLHPAILNEGQISGQSGRSSGQSGAGTGPIGGGDRDGDDIGDASVGWGVLSATDEDVGMGWGERTTSAPVPAVSGDDSRRGCIGLSGRIGLISRYPAPGARAFRS